MRKKISFCLMIFLFFGAWVLPAFSEDEPFYPSALVSEKFPPRSPHPRRNMNPNGWRMPHPEGSLSVIGVKVDEEGDFVTLSVFFNCPLDTDSIEERYIFVNGRSLPPFTEFLFNKNRSMMRFSVRNDFISNEEDFSLKITEARSFGGRKIADFEAENLKSGDFVKIHRERKFSDSEVF